MALQDAPAAMGSDSPPNVPAAGTRSAQDPAPPASLASVPLRRQRRRPAGAPEESAAVPEAARAAPEATETVAAPAGPEAAAVPPQGSESEAGEREVGDIVAFWKGLRGERRFPSWTDLRFEHCAAHWPSSLLLRFPADDGAALPLIEAAFSDAMRAALRADERNRIDHTPLMTDWLIALSQEAARAGRPMHDEQVLPSWRGPTRYRAVALPFSEDQAAIDHVLCHVAHA